jgi:hypothetical protein
MSFPAAASISLGSAAIANPLDIVMASVNSNPYFIGLMMLLLNLGGRFLALEISKEQEKFLSHPVVRRFFLFAVLFVGTRNLIIAAGLTVIVIILLGYLFNENSELCLWHTCINKPQAPVRQEGFVGLTPEEAMILKRLQDKQTAATQQDSEKQKAPEKPQSTAASLYSSALTQLAS